MALRYFRVDAAILLDAKTGDILFEKNIHRHMPPASTTKVLTAILALESGRLDDEVTVSPRAAATPGSSLYLFSGQRLLLRELLTGLLLRSGNDAAVAIAEYLAGSTEAFVAQMNQKAVQIGALDSHFVNPHGLSKPGHYSTAFDLAWITRYALNNDDFSHLVGTRETTIDWPDRRGQEKEQNLRNTNKLLWMFEGADGVKTGTTGQAGQCLIASATRGEQRLISVVLHSQARWTDSARLLNYGFKNFALYTYGEQDELIRPLPVEKGMTDTVDAVLAAPAAVVVKEADLEFTTAQVDLAESIRAPVYQGQKIGEVTFWVRGRPVKTVDIVAAQNVEEKTLLRLFLHPLLSLMRLLATRGIV